jgi:hypothetical protein
MDLSGHTILILDTNVTPFTARLQAAIEHAGAESILARTAGAATDRIATSRISAAAVNIEHRTTAEELGVAYVLYASSEPPGTIVASLARLLLGPP